MVCFCPRADIHLHCCERQHRADLTGPIVPRLRSEVFNVMASLGSKLKFAALAS